MEVSLPTEDRLNRFAIRVMLALAPKPNIAFLLDIPNDVCAQRKDEDTGTEYLNQQRGI